jgi:hypothetical protein
MELSVFKKRDYHYPGRVALCHKVPTDTIIKIKKRLQASSSRSRAGIGTAAMLPNGKFVFLLPERRNEQPAPEEVADYL